MYCQKCGTETTNNNDYCLNCGTPLNRTNNENIIYEKPKSNNFINVVAVIFGIIAITLLSITTFELIKSSDDKNSSVSYTKSSYIDDKYIVVSGIYFDYASVFKFSDGDLVQIVSEDPFSKEITKYYGTYKIEGHKLTISVYQSDLICVLLEDKNIISINGIEAKIIDGSETKIADELTMNAFD